VKVCAGLRNLETRGHLVQSKGQIGVCEALLLVSIAKKENKTSNDSIECAFCPLLDDLTLQYLHHAHAVSQAGREGGSSEPFLEFLGSLQQPIAGY